MARKKATVGKGMEALASAEVSELVKKVEDIPLIDENMEALLASLQPQLEEAELALAEAEKQVTVREANVKAVQLTRKTLSRMMKDSSNPLAVLIKEKEELEGRLNARSRKVDGVNIYRAPDTAPVRDSLQVVSAKIGEIKNSVGLYWAGVLQVNIDEAFEMARADDQAYDDRAESVASNNDSQS
jgi:chromosome segregation ATPase